MVSTRQMSTSLSSSNGGPSEEGLAASTRLSVTTRQSSYASAQRLPSNLISGVQRGNDENSEDQQQKVLLLDLPMEILDKIFSYVGYKKVGQMRVISKEMNQVCSTILNSTFSKLIIQLLNRFQTVKAKMPRRESARRNHPLACECDIIETCYMRLSLLQMTFGKHIERKHCCFFPGGILDEVYNVLNYIRITPKLERPYRVTDELFDLSTMAMEYYKEHIEPHLPELAYFNKDFYDLTSTKSKQSYSLKATSELSDSASEISSPPQSNMVLRKGIRKIKQGMKMYNNQLTVLRSELRNCKRKSSEQGKQIAEQQKLLAEQQKQTLEYATRLDENDKKNEEMSKKFSTLLQELNKCKTELQYWRSKSPATQICTSCGQKQTPAVAPEDYQVLVNQGIKPEDINISIDDVEDSETSSNALSDSGVLDIGTSTEFVFPDESTTAKLLAVNTATKNLKRLYDGTPSSSSFSSSTALSISRDVVTLAAAATSISSPPTTDLTLGLRNNTISAAGGSGSSGGCSTYGIGGSNGSKFGPVAASCSAATVTSCAAGEIDVATAAAFNENLTSATDVTSLNSIVSNETKKARRVQKGSRCHNVSSKRK